MPTYESDSESGDSEQQQPWYVREVDDHTGVADNRGIPYTYEHVEEWPEPDAEVYRIIGIVGLVDRPLHKNVYFVESDRLDEFFNGWGEHGEQLVDVQPVSHADAEDEILEFGDSE